MTTKNRHRGSDVDLLIVRLLKAAVRVERRLYGRNVSGDEIRFHLDWADALLTLAERMNAAREVHSTDESPEPADDPDA